MAHPHEAYTCSPVIIQIISIESRPNLALATIILSKTFKMSLKIIIQGNRLLWNFKPGICLHLVRSYTAELRHKAICVRILIATWQSVMETELVKDLKSQKLLQNPFEAIPVSVEYICRYRYRQSQTACVSLLSFIEMYIKYSLHLNME